MVRVVRFAPAASYSGELAAELHCHGGRAVISAVLQALGEYTGCRMAEPGEFTRRAFMAGRMDLANPSCAICAILVADSRVSLAFVATTDSVVLDD